MFTRTYKPLKIATSGIIGYRNVLYSCAREISPRVFWQWVVLK
ncbi:hypothetical protein [Caldicellulosiruptor owensensis]|nr:hypothetical protein [Caldicellulosiruptor owensensis]